MAFSSFASASTFWLATLTMSRFCMFVARTSPPARRSDSGGGAHLIRGDSAAKNRCPHVKQAGLFLGVNADVVAIHVVRRQFVSGRFELEPETLLEFRRKTLRSPAVTQEEDLRRARSRFSRSTSLSRNLSNPAQDRNDLILLHEGIQTSREVRIRRESTGDTKGETNFLRLRTRRLTAVKATSLISG